MARIASKTYSEEAGPRGACSTSRRGKSNKPRNWSNGDEQTYLESNSNDEGNNGGRGAIGEGRDEAYAGEDKNDVSPNTVALHLIEVEVRDAVHGVDGEGNEDETDDGEAVADELEDGETAKTLSKTEHSVDVGGDLNLLGLGHGSGLDHGLDVDGSRLSGISSTWLGVDGISGGRLRLSGISGTGLVVGLVVGVHRGNGLVENE